jgi:hypothetical protein
MSNRPRQQASLAEGLQYMELSVALNDNVENGSCFACFTGSDTHFKDLCVRNPEMKGDHYQLKSADVEVLNTAGFTEKRMYVKQGDVIVWDSRLVHMGAGATQAEAKTVPRSDSWPACGPAAAFFCLLPLGLTPPKILENKQKAYIQGLKSGVCALETCTHKPGGFHPFFRGLHFNKMLTPGQVRILKNPSLQVLDDEELTMLGLKHSLEVQYVSKPRGSNNQTAELGGNSFVDQAPCDDVAALEQVSSDGHAAGDDVTAPGALFDGQSARSNVATPASCSGMNSWPASCSGCSLNQLPKQPRVPENKRHHVVRCRFRLWASIGETTPLSNCNARAGSAKQASEKASDIAGSRQQAAGRRQQVAGSRQQAAGIRQHAARKSQTAFR